MALDPSIILPSNAVLQSIANPVSPLDIQAKQQALANQRLQSQSLQMGIQEQQRQMQAQQALNQAYQQGVTTDANGRPSFDRTKMQQSLAGSGRMDLWGNLNESLNKVDQSQEDLTKARLANQETQQKLRDAETDHQGMVGVALQDAQYDPAMAMTQIRYAAEHGNIDANTANQLYNQIQQNPTTTYVKTLADRLIGGSTGAKNYLTERGLKQAQAQKDLQDAATGKTTEDLNKLKLPGEQTAATFARAALASNNLATAAQQGGDAYKGLLATEPEDVQGLLKSLGPNPSAQTVFRALLPPDKQREFDKQTFDEKARQTELAIQRGNLGVAQSRLGLEAQKQAAEIGPGAVQGWIDSMKQDPDTWKNVPPALRNGVQLEWQKQTGLPVPRELPTEAKNGEYNSQVALSHIANMRQLLADPDVQGSIGPIAGRIARGETALGAALSKDPKVAQKQQQLMTAMEYLFVREAKSLMGGRPPQTLMNDLKQVSVNPAMNMPLLQGSLDAAQSSAQRTIDTAQQYRFGGARPKQGVTMPGAPATDLQQLRQKYNY